MVLQLNSQLTLKLQLMATATSFVRTAAVYTLLQTLGWRQGSPRIGDPSFGDLLVPGWVGF
jgi:hypothetical protein